MVYLYLLLIILIHSVKSENEIIKEDGQIKLENKEKQANTNSGIIVYFKIF
jgi:hypothetical protein